MSAKRETVAASKDVEIECAHAPAGDGAVYSPFMGRWSCTETRTLTFATPAGSPDAKTETRFIVTANVADGVLAIYATNEAGANCTLNYKETGASALLMDSQSCTALDGITLTLSLIHI